MKTKIGSLSRVIASVVAVAGIAAPSLASAYSGAPFYGQYPAYYSPLRAYYDYINETSNAGFDAVEALASGQELYELWIDTSPNYALSFYYDGVAESNASYFYDYTDLISAYYLYIGLQYYYNYYSFGQGPNGQQAYSLFLQAMNTINSPYYQAAYDAYDVYGFSVDMNGAPLGTAAVYAYYFDQSGY